MAANQIAYPAPRQASSTTTVAGDVSGTLAAVTVNKIGGVTVAAENADGFVIVPIGSYIAVSGTWTLTRQGAAIRRLRRTAAAASEVVSFEAGIKGRTTASKGTKITGAVIQYRISAEVADNLTVAGYVNNTPDSGTGLSAGTSLGAVSYDAAHDTAGERGAVAQHTMVVTFASPAYLTDAGSVDIEITITDTTGGGAVFDIFQVVLLTTEVWV